MVLVIFHEDSIVWIFVALTRQKLQFIFEQLFRERFDWVVRSFKFTQRTYDLCARRLKRTSLSFFSLNREFCCGILMNLVIVNINGRVNEKWS